MLINDVINCRLCKDLDITFRITNSKDGEKRDIIRYPGEEKMKSKRDLGLSSGKGKVDKEKMKKFRMLNEVNKSYFESSKMFDI